MKELIENHLLGEIDEELQLFIDTYIPLEKLASGKAKGDRVYLDHQCIFVASLFKLRHKLVGIYHMSDTNRCQHVNT
jgi:hypothetical protein